MLTLDAYEVRDVVHRGQRSTVLRATRRADGVPVVIKHPSAQFPTPGELRRLKFELEVGTRLGDADGLRYLGSETAGASLAIVMEDVGGESLEHRLARGVPALRDFLRDAIQLAERLASLHALGFVHGDVKPANVIVGTDGRLVLCDFGNSIALENVTRPSNAFGTLAYIAPEQTGRTDRIVDHRADLYSLGATLFHILVGRRPFESDDPLELLHAHLARPVAAPSSMREGVPAVLDGVLMRLMAKDPSDRYQTASGLRFDLERCLTLLSDAGSIASFPLGERDVPHTLTLSDRVVGRDALVAQLVGAFDDLRPGKARYVFLKGASGIGKTAIVRELRPHLAARRAHFCSGKFEELRRHVPYSAVFGAVREMLREILSYPEDRLVAWKSRLLEAVGVNGRLLTDALPELERILGLQPNVAVVSAAEAQARFALVAESFVVALSAPEAPVVLFLDDLQWADDASLRLLEALSIVHSATLLVVGAYRDDEVGDGHPFALSCAEIARSSPPESIEVGPLDVASVEALLRESLRSVDASVKELASLLHASTGGNPFFLRELASAIHREGLLRFDTDAGRWHFEPAALTSRGFTDNVVDLMVRELGAFSEGERHVLAIASVIGARFDRATLAAVASVSQERLEALLQAPLRRRFISSDPSRDGEYRFAHDRIQEAAYELVEASSRPELHHAIGMLLAASDGFEDRLFDVVAHLNAGRELVASDDERVMLVDLNLRAAQVAKASNAWRAAMHHMDVTRELLGARAHQSDYARWLVLCTLSAEVSYVLGDEARTDAAIDQILEHARTDLDRAAAYRLRVLAYLARNKLERGLATAKELAASVGVHLPARAKTHHVVLGLLRAKWSLRSYPRERVLALPSMTDSKALVAMEVLSSVVTTTFLAEPELYPLLVFEQIRMTLASGIAGPSAEAWASYAMIVVAALDDVDEALRAIETAKQLVERTRATHRRHRIGLCEGAFVAPWVSPMRVSLDILLESHRAGTEAGDTEYASLTMSAACFHALMLGENLDDLDAMLVRHLDAIRRTNHKHGEDDVRRQLQFVRNLRGASHDPRRMKSVDYDEEVDLAEQVAAGAKNSASAIAWYQANLALYFRDIPRATECIDAALADVMSHQGTILGTRIWFTHAIAHLQAGRIARSGKALALLRKLAKRVPTSFGHLADLIQAERARVGGRDEEAARFYESAMQGALSASAPHDAALAAELACRYWLARGVTSIANAYLTQARHCHRTWGSAAKVAALDTEFGRTTSALPSESLSIVDVTVSETSGRLDLGAAIRSSNAVASERTVDGVTRRVLACLLGDVGAQRAVLLLLDEHGQLVVAAESTADRDFATVGLAIESYDGVPERIVRFTHRSASAIVLRDAANVGEYTQDPYVVARKSKSILSAPLARQGQIVGVIYLENDLAVGVFSSDRIDLVTMLAAQAAVSIANAELYESLERRVAERTEELEVRNRFIRQTFGRYLSNDVVASLLETPEGLALGGEKRRVTILMSDLRGFSGLSERLAPEQVVKLLNNFLSEMTDVILAYQGTIDEFIGDAILTIFGAPLARPDDAERAIACAIAMQQAMARVNAWNVENGLPVVEMGIGVNTGEVVVGNIGSQKRAKYGVVGSHVNLASRIESYTVGGQILVSESTLWALKSTVRVDARLTVHPKGVAEPLTLHDVGAIDGPHAIAIDHVEDVPVPLRKPTPLKLAELRGKNAGAAPRGATIVGLSPRGAELALADVPEELSDLRLHLEGDRAPTSDVYAKVVRSKAPRAGHCTVRFTSLSEECRGYLDSLRDP